jgi:hypothetical protein
VVAARKTEANVVLSSLFIIFSKVHEQDDRMIEVITLASLRR